MDSGPVIIFPLTPLIWVQKAAYPTARVQGRGNNNANPNKDGTYLMGREYVEVVRVSALVSRHNSDRDAIDDSLADELRHRIEMIVREHQYERISAMVV